MSSGFDPVPSDRLEITNERGAALTDFDYRVAACLLKLTNSLQLPKDTLGYLVEYLSLNQPVIPVSQLSGFSSFNAQSARVETEESTASGTYTDLATVGPQLTALPDGEYVVMYGCYGQNSGTSTARISLKVNSTEAIDAEAAVALVGATNVVSIMSAAIKTLSNNGNNTLTCRYRAGSGTSTFGTRWLIAFKYAEL